MLNDWDWMRILEFIIGILSIIGCFFILVMFVLYKKLRSFQFELVCHLTFSCLMSSISYLINYIPMDDFINNKIEILKYAEMDVCKVQAFLMVWFENAQYMCSTLIAYSVYKYVIYFEEANKKTSWTKRILYALCAYMLPLIISLIGLLCNSYGVSGNWCWFDIDKHALSKIFVSIIYWIVWILVITNFIFYCQVISFLNRELKSKEEQELAKKYMWKLIRYPVIQTVCIIPASISRFLEVFFDIKGILVLQYTHMIFVILQGFFYALAYGFTPQVRLAIMESLKKVFCLSNMTRKESQSSIKSSKYSDDDIDSSREDRLMKTEENNGKILL